MPAVDDASCWRTRASDAALLAGRMRRPETRLSMLEIARSYEALAEHAERRARQATRLVDAGVPEHSPTEEGGEGVPSIEGPSFGPEALRALCRAFDKAWRSIAANFGDDPREVDAARAGLANALLSIADGGRDVDVLATTALQAVAIEYRAALAGHNRAWNREA